MGSPSQQEVTGSFTGTGQSSTITVSRGEGNMSLSGVTAGSGTVVLQRSFDAGSTWWNVETFTDDAEKVIDEPGVGVLYRLNCTVYASGTFTYRLGIW